MRCARRPAFRFAEDQPRQGDFADPRGGVRRTPYLVQVVIDESAKTRFLGSDRANGQIWIRGDIRTGRSVAVREGMILAMMREVASIAGVKENEIWVYLCNLEPTDMVEHGHVLPAPGQEKAWFDALPEDLKAYLSGLGTNR